MSSVNESTQYQFSFSISSETGENDGGFVLTAGAGVTDEIALGIAKAFNSQPWPAGVVNPMTVTKQDMEYRVYTTNLTLSPPTFT
ncbi:hypothetical protein GCM10010331_49010 [Streptomyces xanthochromogenes]|uniref:hypothetical protein n=1 Tax=Streptomyces xanthochromogenes TaxID=67384 RepID=UPI001671B0FB|nr:hypothetical protein [Streptomyces xanthochromogenes]GHB55383.1 hypothetical protein GCM10010331_49010 [Streptomyces xanthochromogenes]